MPTWLSSALERLPLPEQVTAALIERTPRHHDALAKNPAIGTLAATLATKKLCAQSMGEIACSDHPEVLDAILSTRERRDGVLATLLSYWRLGASDQLRFVNRSLSESIANQVLTSDRFGHDAKLVAHRRASLPTVETWLLTSALSDQKIFDLLSAYRAKRPSDLSSTTLALASARPGLRHLLANATVPCLIEAACYAPINSVEDQRRVVEFVTNNSNSVMVSSFVALLLQPSLDRDLRYELWQLLDELPSNSYQSVRYECYRYGVATPEADIHVGRPLGSVTDNSVVEKILTSQVVAQRGYQDVNYLRAGVLFDLCGNPHLDADTKQRLLVQAVSLFEESTFRNIDGLATAVASLASSLADDQKHCHRMLRLAGSWHGFDTSLEARSRRQANQAASAAKTTSERSGAYGRDVLVAKLGTYGEPEKESPSRTSWYRNDEICHLAAYLTGRLGDGSTSDSLDAWFLFFDMGEQTPTASFEQLADTALRMARLGNVVPQ